MRKIGNCTLYHGNCLEVIESLGEVDNVITDPPYGMNYVSGRRKEQYEKIENDNNADIALKVIDWSINNIKR